MIEQKTKERIISDTEIEANFPNSKHRTEYDNINSTWFHTIMLSNNCLVFIEEWEDEILASVHNKDDKIIGCGYANKFKVLEWVKSKL